MVKVCDAIMGSGKSESAIRYMNDHPEKKFVYITPYLEEAKRITDCCPSLDFKEPSNKIPGFNFSKLEHTRHLLKAGENIATTHSAFRAYTNDMAESISNQGYTLIVDEAVEVLCEANCSYDDVRVLLKGGYLKVENEMFIYTGEPYTHGRLKDIISMFKCNNMVYVKNSRGDKGNFYYWMLPRTIIQAFSDVIILTYMFDSSEFKYFLDMNHIPFDYIYVRKSDDGYSFTDQYVYTPEYVPFIKDRVQIFKNNKLNSVGRNRHALSANWMMKHPEEKKKLKNNVYTYLRYYQNAKQDGIMWATYKKDISSLRGRGFTKSHVEFNKKASNDYRDRDTLAYCVNLFPSPQKVQFFAQHGINYDADGYALSAMVQWIWRSAIRDGKEINIYIPSLRMRKLLTDWLDSLADSKDGDYIA